MSWETVLPEDREVWHPATAAEAHLLCREWEQAAPLYREALESKKISHHARESMRRQVERIIMAFRHLGVDIPPPFDDPAALFAPGPTSPGFRCSEAVADGSGR